MRGQQSRRRRRPGHPRHEDTNNWMASLSDGTRKHEVKLDKSATARRVYHEVEGTEIEGSLFIAKSTRQQETSDEQVAHEPSHSVATAAARSTCSTEPVNQSAATSYSKQQRNHVQVKNRNSRTVTTADETARWRRCRGW